MPRVFSPQSKPPSTRPLIGADLERCLYCHGTRITRAGKRHNTHETLQRWYCHTCNAFFTSQPAARGKVFPLKVILDALCHFYGGHTLDRTAQHVHDRFGYRLHPRTLSRWLAEYRELTTYARLRPAACRRFTPHNLIRSTRLHHKQVYTYRVHQGKLALILKDTQHEAFSPIADYLTEMATACPHDLFQEEHRASAAANAFDLAGVEIVERQNLAPRIAHLALQAVTHNKRRHDELQRFMLMTDSVTVAVEVPVYLTPADLRHLTEDLGFHVPLPAATTLTGHIDVLQIRNGRVHILDYKPGAVHERPIAQLMVYALALSRRTGLRLYDFVCAWFDDQHYFEFYPLHVVHKRGARRHR
jgi:PD-(D/E)XK nuclease superfamily protein